MYLLIAGCHKLGVLSHKTRSIVVILLTNAIVVAMLLQALLQLPPACSNPNCSIHRSSIIRLYRYLSCAYLATVLYSL